MGNIVEIDHQKRIARVQPESFSINSATLPRNII